MPKFTCRWFKREGGQCGEPAMRGRTLCRYHAQMNALDDRVRAAKSGVMFTVAQERKRLAHDFGAVLLEDFEIAQRFDEWSDPASGLLDCSSLHTWRRTERQEEE